MRDRITCNEEGEADPCIHRDAADQRYQPLVTFTVVGFIHQTNFIRYLAGDEQEEEGKYENYDKFSTHIE